MYMLSTAGAKSMENPKIVRVKYVMTERIELHLKKCELCGQESYIERNRSLCANCRKRKN
jgi:uncharacterized membrane protein